MHFKVWRDCSSRRATVSSWCSRAAVVLLLLGIAFSGGCFEVNSPPPSGQGATDPPGKPPEPPPQPPAPPKPDRKPVDAAAVTVKTIGKQPAKLVNAAEATQNPKVVIVENKVNASDPFSSAISVYISAAARVSTLGLQQAVKAHQALNGKYPTFAEFEQMVKQNRVEFAPLPPYRMYGYDEKTGGIVILEDKAEKIRLYKENGIPLDPGDEKFE